MTLADATFGRPLRIAKLDLEDDVAAWLSAVGLEAGEELVVLRRGAFGGPLHIRTSSGGEFAVARELAAKMTMEDV